jgi:hypothetical protein
MAGKTIPVIVAVGRSSVDGSVAVTVDHPHDSSTDIDAITPVVAEPD